MKSLPSLVFDLDRPWGAPRDIGPMRLIALLTALVLSLSVAVATASAATEYEGTVASINKDKRTFRLNDSERGTIRIKVTRNTVFERISGFSGLRVGMKRVEATVKRSNGRWVAIRVERSGGGGSHGGGGGGADDGPNHT
jgi:hypothetical protein